MIRVAAFVLLIIASLLVILDDTWGRYGPIQFLIFGVTVYVLSTIWDRNLR